MSKVILITGVSSGFGKAIAECLSAEGHRVYGICRKPQDVEANSYRILHGDVTNLDSIQKAVDDLLKKESGIDVLINNAGMGIGGPVEFSSASEIRIQMDTNFYGMVNMIKSVLPIMRAQQNGVILNISSIGGIMGLPYQGFYSASKFAIEGLSEGLRMELKAFNIKVVVIRPGDFHTNFTSNRKIIEKVTGNPYEDQCKKTLSIIEQDENGGLNSQFLANKISKILRKKNPDHHYVIATAEQKLAVTLKKFLPSSMFFSLLGSHYGLK